MDAASTTAAAAFPDLRGASVFATGGGSGIGAALTEGFLRRDARVASCRRSDGAPFAQAMEEATDARPPFLPCDLTDVVVLRETLARAAEAQGPMMGDAGHASYATANAGITGLTRALACEFGPDGVRVEASAPRWALTGKPRETWAADAGLAAHVERQRLLRHLAPADIVGPCSFLTSKFLASKASVMVTGQAVAADGGVVFSG